MILRVTTVKNTTRPGVYLCDGTRSGRLRPAKPYGAMKLFPLDEACPACRKVNTMRTLSRSRLLLLLLVSAMSAGIVAAQSSVLVSEIKIQTDPADARIRPFESIVIQVRAYGDIEDANGNKQKVRLREGGASVKLSEDNAGWLSKPFRFQGKDDESFYQKESAGLAAILLGQAQNRFLLQDAVLFTASDRTGKFKIEAELNGQKATLEVQVENNAPSQLEREKTSFDRLPASTDPYRKLVEHYAPMVAQETWFEPKSDYLARVDLDGDWRGDNNWENAFEGTSQAYVYYAVMETETHWFLVYNFFHPRDYSDKCVVGTCHENDNEGMILTVAKDRSTFGRLQTMESLAHNNIYSYRLDRAVKNNVHNIDGDIELHDNSHPVIFIEAGGHGVFGADDNHSLYSVRDSRFSNTGVTYIYKGVAERPKHGNDRNVGYNLLPIYDHWWLRAHQGNGKKDRTFDAYFRYEPFGNRPRAPYPEIAGSFYGRSESENKAKPFWGWHDNRTLKKKVLATGQWGLDPAYGVSQNLSMPRPFSLRYTFNPYLGIGRPTASPVAPPATPTAPSVSTQQPQPTGASTVTSASGFDETPSFSARPGGNLNANSKKGEFDVRVRVDGQTDVLIQGDQVRYRVVSHQPPAHEGAEFTQPLPRASFKTFEVEKRAGRGTVTLFQPPGAGNDYTARVRVDDPKGGDDLYHIRLKWEWDELAAPLAPDLNTAPERAPEAPVVSSPSGIFDRHPGSVRSTSVPSRSPSAATSSARKPTAPVPGRARSSSTPGRQPSAPTASTSQQVVVPGVEVFSKENRPEKYDLEDDDGELKFEAKIDGTAIIRVFADRIFVETVNGRTVEVEEFEFSQPLPAGRVSKIELDQRDGRGEMILLERPWEGNNYQAVIQVSDPESGDDKYGFDLEWER